MARQKQSTEDILTSGFADLSAKLQMAGSATAPPRPVTGRRTLLDIITPKKEAEGLPPSAPTPPTGEGTKPNTPEISTPSPIVKAQEPPKSAPPSPKRVKKAPGQKPLTQGSNPSFSPSESRRVNPSLDPSLNPSENVEQQPNISDNSTIFSETVNPSLNPSIDPSLSNEANPSLYPSSNPSGDVTPSEGSTQGLVDPSVNPSEKINPSLDPSLNLSLAPSTNPSSNPSEFRGVNPSLNPSLNPSFNPSDLTNIQVQIRLEIEGFSPNKMKVLRQIIEGQPVDGGPYFTSKPDLFLFTQVPFDTIKTYMAQLSQAGYFRTQRKRLGKKQGFLVNLDQGRCRVAHGILRHKLNFSTPYPSLDPTFNPSLNPSEFRRVNPSFDPSLNPSGSVPLNDRMDGKDLILPSSGEGEPKKGSPSLTAEDIEALWPALAARGFTLATYTRAVHLLALKSHDPAGLTLALDYADTFFADQPKGQEKTFEGTPILDPIAYILGSLSKSGTFRRPVGYLSPDELAELNERARNATLAQAEVSMQAELQKAAQKAQDSEYAAWRSGLSSSELSQLLKNKKGPEEQWLKNHFTKIKNEGIVPAS